jgi:hypothetical protein
LRKNSELPSALVDSFVEFAVDDADFGVSDAIAFTLRVEDGVDVEAGSGWFA